MGPMSDAPRAPEVRIVLTTCPDADAARRIGSALVAERLAACVNLLPGVESVYRWQGSVERATEVLLLVKTRREALPRLTRRVAELHPYELPEVVAVPVDGGSDAYCRWILDNTDVPDAME